MSALFVRVVRRRFVRLLRVGSVTLCFHRKETGMFFGALILEFEVWSSQGDPSGTTLLSQVGLVKHLSLNIAQSTFVSRIQTLCDILTKVTFCLSKRLGIVPTYVQ